MKAYFIVIFLRGEYKPPIAGPVIWANDYDEAYRKAHEKYPGVPVCVEEI